MLTFRNNLKNNLRLIAASNNVLVEAKWLPTHNTRHNTTHAGEPPTKIAHPGTIRALMSENKS